ncbi:MAG: VCBS repeat-containing protein [Bryobacteraceae bacterium]
MRLLVSAICVAASLSAAEVWTDETFEDFSRGRVDAAGQNLFVSRDGRVRTIQRYDLNRDGYFDLVFNSTHDYSYFQPAVVASSRGRVELPVEGSQRVWIGDLNRDGWADAVFCPSDSGLQNPRRYLKIAWGAADGFSPSRISGILPVYGAIAAVAADVNHDNWPDIVTLNQKAWSPGQPAGNIVRVYLGGDRGFQSARFKDYGIADATDIFVKGQEALVMTKTGARRLDGMKSDASNAVTADLDGDGKPDSIVTGSHGVRVLWGMREPATTIPVKYATAAAAVDFNEDGKLDLAISVHQTDAKLEAQSVIYLGKGSRQFERGPEFTTWGASHVAAVAREKDTPPRVIFANALNGTVAEKVPIYVYWGAKGGFANAKRWEIPLQSGYESSAADLNGDGWPDLIALNSGHVGEAADKEPTLGANIFWGSPNGFDLGRRTVLAEANIGSSAVADLDRDGYLDVVLGAFDSTQTRDRLVIYYGGKDGFSKARRQALSNVGRAVSLSLADFTGDGWLDIAAVDSTRDMAMLFEGSAKGFDPKRVKTIHVPFAISLETADLNGDGWLDWIVGSYQDRESGGHDGGLYLFWGSPSGFRQSNSQWLPGFAPVGPVVADFDGDGSLDIFSPHYLGNGTRESVPSYLYWGSKDGFHPRRRTALITDSAHDGMAADFDGDGKIDLAVSCHTTDGDHRAASKIFYNDGRRFANPRVETLPTIGPHWMWDQDMGHIATRQWKQTYESRVFELKHQSSRFTWEVAGETPEGAQLGFATRWATSKAELERAQWMTAPASAVEMNSAARFVQYRITLESPNGDRYPEVDRVTLRFE